jgi:RNA polymerase sigma factor (sigma-70 family)
MTEKPLQTMLYQLRRLVTQEGAGALSDAQLLDHFVTRRDELAFEVLLWRHGAMVLDVCRRLLRQEQDAEDAFQATFLVLVRKAGSIGKRESVGSWLYKVAYRVACAARGVAIKQVPHELALGVANTADPTKEILWRDLAPVLDEEVNRLPDKYRVPVVLCYLQGKTVEEAARQLGCPRGTVGTRLARARQRLRSRLAGRGVALGSVALVSLLSQTEAGAAPSAALVAATLRILTVPTSLPVGVAALTEGVITAMFLSKLKIAAAVALVLAAFATGLGGVSLRTQAAEEPGRSQEARPPARAPKEIPPPRQAIPNRVLCTSCHAVPVHEPPLKKKGTVFADLDRDGWPDLLVSNDNSALWHDYSLNLLHKPGARMALRGWGVVFDPADDCKFGIGQDKLTITIPGKDHALAVERGQMNAPRVLQEVEGDFIVQVRVAADFPKGAKSVVEGRRPFHSAGLLIFQDNKNFVRLESAGMVFEDKNYRYASFELRQNGEFLRQGDAHEHALTGKEHYLRLERRDGKFIASVSANGVRWDPLEPLSARLSRRILVGISAGQNTSTGFAPQFVGYRVFREGTR